MNIPLSAINISEEVNKSGVWKQVNENNKSKKKSPKSNSRFKKKKTAKKDEKREEKTKLEKRLSTMTEEEEDEGITIKCEKDFWLDKKCKSNGTTTNETNV